MNAKANELGMQNTRFYDPTGLSRDNVSTAQDLVKMVAAARNYPLIQQYSTAATLSVDGLGGREMRFSNTNPLVRAPRGIGVKTGFISEAGLCTVMEAKINQRPVIIVLQFTGKRTHAMPTASGNGWKALTRANTALTRPAGCICVYPWLNCCIRLKPRRKTLWKRK